MAHAQDLYVGSNSSGDSTNFSSGTNSYGNTFIGYDSSASNNLLTVDSPGTLLTNSGNLYVGYDGSSNSLVISNGAQVVNNECFIGSNTSSSNNSVLVSDGGTLWSNGLSLSIGNDGSFNSLVISNGGQTFVGAFATIGNNAASSNNSVVVTSNALWTTYYDLYIGHAGSFNSLEVSGGGTVTVLGDPWPDHYNGSVIGSASNSSNNSVVISGIGSTLNSPNLYVGDFGSSNSLTISNNAQVLVDGTTVIGNNTNSSNNSVVVSDAGTLWSNGGNLYLGNDGSSSNSLVISNGAQVLVAATTVLGNNASSSNNSVVVSDTSTLLTNAGDFFVGLAGSSNSLVVSNGAQVIVGNNTVISHIDTSSNNSVVVTGGGSTLTTLGGLYVGNLGSDNSLTISNGAQVANVNGFIGNNVSASNNSVVVTDSGTLWTNAGDLYVGNLGSSNSLTISNGAQVANVTGFIGNDVSASNNSVVVTDAGTLWTNAGDLYVGNLGSGNSLTISNGAQVVNINGWIGNQSSSSNNSVVVSDSGTIWTNQGGVIVGHDGSSNSLVISNGAQVIAATGAAIGNNPSSSNNMVVVTGAGSVLSTPGDLYVGSGGSFNSLVISDGGKVFNSNSAIGNWGSGSNNSVLVTGIGSLWSNSGTVDIGENYVGGASLALDQGGSVTASNIFIRPRASLSGNGTITMTDPIGLNVFGGGTLSPTGPNSLVINGNLNFNNQYPYVDYRQPATLLWNLDGNTNGPAGSTNFSPPITLNGALEVGYATFDINLGSNVSPSDSFWSNSATWTVINGTNPLTQGANFNMALSGNTNGFAIGAKFWEYSTNVNSFYLVTSGNSLQLLYSVGDFWTSATNYWTNGGNWSRGLEPGVTSQPIIDNGGTAILETAGQAFNLYVGFTNSGSTLLITNGGQLSVTNLAYIGYGENSSNNSVIVTGAGALWSNSGSGLAVGYLGSGNSLVISDGAQVIADNNNYIQTSIGYGTNSSNNSVLVTGAGSTWTNVNYGGFYVGQSGSGNSLVISNGGTVDLAASHSDVYIGSGATSSNNRILVTGPNSALKCEDYLYVGSYGSGNSLVISNGGFVGGGDLYASIAGYNSSNNSVLVTGAGSTFKASYLAVGDWGGSSSSLTVVDGGTVASGTGYIGYYASNNSVLVSGTNSSLAFTNGFFVGYGGDGNSLTITDGASVTVVCTSDSDYFSLGEADAASGNTLTVSGASTLSVNVATNSAYGIWIGDTANSSNNAMVVSGGGKVYSGGESAIGYNRGALSNSALITGAGSLWTNNGVLEVGGSSGQGILTVANGGTVAATTITVATNAGSTGVLNIGRFGTNDAAGIIDTPTIAFGAGTGSINFNQSDSTTVSAAISGNGSVNQLGTGTTTLSGDNIYTGTTLISAGTLLANNTAGSALGSSSVTVQSGGTLGGNGMISGPVTIASGGTLTPGSGGIGALSLSNGLTLNDGAITSFLINDTNNYTSLNIQGGIVSYGGTMRLDLTSYAASAAPGDTFALFSTWGGGATNTNNFSSLIAIGASMTFTDVGGLWSATDMLTGLNYQFSDATGNLTVTAAVPEPSTYALFGLGAIMVIAVYRRNKGGLTI
jgi:T5SS/PEP-CTERM-associated repeat protein